MNLILLKDLPDCPKGSVFKETTNGNFFNARTDYVFSPGVIERNPGWFVRESSFNQPILESETFQILRSLSNLSGRTIELLFEELEERELREGLPPVEIAGRMYGECLFSVKGVG